jgi:hypothetical protein
MTSMRARHPQRFIPIHEMIDLGSFTQRRFFHEARQRVGAALHFRHERRAFPGCISVAQCQKLQPVGYDFLIDFSRFKHIPEYAGMEARGR